MMIRRPVFLSRPEEFVNLQGLPIQSSNGFASEQYLKFNSLVISLTGKFVQFSLGHGGQVPPSSSVHSFQFTNFSKEMRSWSRSRSRQSRHISAGAGAVGTFCSELEPEPSKIASAPAGKRGKITKKKVQNVKRENTESIIFIAQFLPFLRTSHELE